MKNKILYIIAIVLVLILIAAVVFISVKNSDDNKNSADLPQYVDEESDKAQIKPVELPDKKELKDLKLENVIQTDKINKQFVLANYEVDGAKLIYYFQADAITNGQKLTVTAFNQNHAEYELTLPAGNKAEKVNIGEYEMTFYDRMIYFVEDESVDIPSVIQQNVESGNAQIRYRSGAPELVSCQSMQWYDDGIAYNMESLGRNYTVEDMSGLVSDYLNNRK